MDQILSPYNTVIEGFFSGISWDKVPEGVSIPFPLTFPAILAVDEGGFCTNTIVGYCV